MSAASPLACSFRASTGAAGFRAPDSGVRHDPHLAIPDPGPLAPDPVVVLEA